MARPRSESRDKLLLRAMRVFWRTGYHGTSMESLVQATEVARGGIYADFGGKSELFKACIDYYRDNIAAPAIAILKSELAGLEAIEAYLQYFVGLHHENGLPGPGCFVANTMTEVAPHEEDIRALVDAHNQILEDSFLFSLTAANKKSTNSLPETELSELAQFLVTSTQGLWSYARAITDMAVLENFVGSLMQLLRARLAVPAVH
ncbi:MAG: TetR/AcrR family transcriptional regulator [Pseudomonadota bacterium]